MTNEPPTDEQPEEPPLADHLRNHPDRFEEPERMKQTRSQIRLLLLMLFAAAPLMVVLVIVLTSLASGPPSTRQTTDGGTSGGLAQVTRYCNYAAQTDEEFEPCLDEHRDRDFLGDGSNAARYATGELTRCLEDAGPRCTARQGVKR